VDPQYWWSLVGENGFERKMPKALALRQLGLLLDDELRLFYCVYGVL
jgi:hypothetical protein